MSSKAKRSVLSLCLLSGAASTAAALASKELVDAVDRGKSFYDKNKCANCHSIKQKGGCLAPPLDGIAKTKGKKFILARITNSPEAISDFTRLFLAQELMPHPRLSPSIARDISEYLLTLPSAGSKVKVAGHKLEQKIKFDQAHKSTEKSVNDGKRLFYAKGCMECHSVLGAGGELAPALDGIGKRVGREAILSRINSAELLQLGLGGEYQLRGTSMPPSNLSRAEVSSIADFLMSLSERRTK